MLPWERFMKLLLCIVVCLWLISQLNGLMLLLYFIIELHRGLTSVVLVMVFLTRQYGLFSPCIEKGNAKITIRSLSNKEHFLIITMKILVNVNIKIHVKIMNIDHSLMLLCSHKYQLYSTSDMQVDLCVWVPL